MFKNLIVYRIAAHTPLDLGVLEAALQTAPFAACGLTQERSGGFVPPRGDAHGALVESVGGQWIARYLAEQRLLPSAVVAEAVAERCQAIEAEQGRRPGRREQADLREAARLELLPRAFTRQRGTWLWLDPVARLLMLDVASQSRADEIVTALVAAWPSLHVSLLQTAQSPRAAMAAWLQDGSAPGPWNLERECELKSADEQRSVVRYARHSLDIEEVRSHIQQGKLPTRLALGFNGGAVTLVLTETMQIKKIAFADIVLDQAGDAGERMGGGGDGGFDADVAIATGTLSQAIAELIDALGGEVAEGALGADFAPVGQAQNTQTSLKTTPNSGKSTENAPYGRLVQSPVSGEVAPVAPSAKPSTASANSTDGDWGDPLALAAAIVHNHSQSQSAAPRASWFPAPKPEAEAQNAPNQPEAVDGMPDAMPDAMTDDDGPPF